MKLIPSLLLAMLLVASAKAKAEGDTLRSRIYFPVGVSKIDHSFQGNGVRLEFMIRDIHARMKQSRLRKVRLSAGASLEGNSALNRRLSDERLQSLSDVFHERLSVPDSIYEYHSLGENWEGLLALVERSDMPHRDEALLILRDTPVWVVRDGQVVDGRKRQLMNLWGGAAWRYMEKNFFPQLRNCTIVECEFEPVATEPEERPAVVSEVLTECDTIILRDTVCPADELPAPRPLYLAAKTNLLYDAALVPNVGLELSLGKGWSVGGNWMYAHWSNDARHRYWQIYGGELEVRRYFGSLAAEKPLQGHHVSLYAQAVTYDFETGGKGYLSDFAYGVGLEYGYSLPVAKRLNIDFGIGIGYSGGKYKSYYPDAGCYVYIDTKRRHWFGPTRAEVSLVWLLGRGNVNSKKGGAK